MKAVSIVYWSRAGLGVLAGFVSALVSSPTIDTLAFFNGISIALLIYIVTYYVFRSRFIIHFEKPSKIFSTGIGAYFLTWIVAWVVIFTLIGPTLIVTNPAPNAIFLPNGTMSLSATITNSFGARFSGANVTAIITSTDTSLQLTNKTIQLTETSPGTYAAEYIIPSNNSTGQWNLIVAATVDHQSRTASVPLKIQANS